MEGVADQENAHEATQSESANKQDQSLPYWSQILALGRAISNDNNSNTRVPTYAPHLAPLLYGAQLISSLQNSKPDPYSGVAAAAAEHVSPPPSRAADGSVPPEPSAVRDTYKSSPTSKIDHRHLFRQIGGATQEQPPSKRSKPEHERPPPGGEHHSRASSAAAASNAHHQPFGPLGSKAWVQGLGPRLGSKAWVQKAGKPAVSVERSTSTGGEVGGSQGPEDSSSRKMRRKESNRESARRSRQRKAEGEEKRQAEIEALTQANKHLRLEMAKLEARLEETHSRLIEAQKQLQKPS